MYKSLTTCEGKYLFKIFYVFFKFYKFNDCFQMAEFIQC